MENNICFSHVSKVYKSGDKKVYALKDVSFELGSGKFIVVLGPSGAGKSTLLNLLGGMDTCEEGDMRIFNQHVSMMDDNELAVYRSHHVGFIFQFYNLIPTLTVYENVALIKELKKDTLDVFEILESVGLKEHANKFPSQLSGGEQQRVSIARALCKNGDLLLCDEPTGALDSQTGATILKLLRCMVRERKQTVIIVTHNAIIADTADIVVRVKNGGIESITHQEHPLSIDEVKW